MTIVMVWMKKVRDDHDQGRRAGRAVAAAL